MRQVLLVCAAFLSVTATVRAEEPTETVVRLTLHPSGAPRPALRYQLLPELRELNPGNSIQEYLKCFAEQNNFFFNTGAVENREKWSEMPLKDLPLATMHQFGYGKGGRPLSQADYAARLDTADWQLLISFRREGAMLLVPEIQQMRTLAAALQIRFRVEVAERRFDDALVSAKTLFAMSRHVGEHPTLVGQLVSWSIVSLATDTLTEMLEQPGCPNLFWALTVLPAPLIDLRKGLQGDRLMVAVEFGDLDDKDPMSDTQIQKVIKRTQDLLVLVQGSREKVGDVRAWVTKYAADQGHVAAARKRLADCGLDAGKLKEFPAQQVVLLDEKLAFEIMRDDETKLMALPYWQFEKEKARNKARPGADQALYAHLMQMPSRVRQTQARADQRIAALRCVEALRIYAAEHDGKLPEKLDDVKTPLPVDPISGRAFTYKLDNGAVTLKGMTPAGMEQNAFYNVRYEIKVAK